MTNRNIGIHSNSDPPRTEVVFYQDQAGWAPVREWLRELRTRDAKAHAKCVARIARLADLGHELRRPEADYLCNGIHELRARKGHVNYRILYFFHGARTAVLSHACTKEGAVPVADIARALERKTEFAESPSRHSHEE